jgi:hypothetical protein
MVFIHPQTRELLLHLGGMREKSRNGVYGLSQMVRPNAWAGYRIAWVTAVVLAKTSARLTGVSERLVSLAARLI